MHQIFPVREIQLGGLNMQKEKTKRDKILIVVGEILLAIVAFSIPIVAAQILENGFIIRIIVAVVGFVVLYPALPALVKEKGKRLSYWGIYGGGFVIMIILFRIFARES
jgi:hypothetical protein